MTQSVRPFLSHIRKEHHGNRRTDFQCMKCKGRFDNIYRFDKHIKNCYKFLEQSVPANLLNSSVERSQTFESFSRSVIDVDPVVNDYCSENSNNSGVLTSKSVVQCESFCEDSPMPDDFVEQESDINNFEINILNAGLKFSLALHSKPNINRQNVTDIQNIVGNLTSEIFQLVKNRLRGNCSLLESEYDEIFDLCCNPFKTIKSEYLLKKELKNRGLLENFLEFPINEQVGVVFEKGKSKLDTIVNKGVLLPIEFQIEQFLKKNDRLIEMVKNKDKFMNDEASEIKHFVQCQTWKNIMSENEVDDNTILLPIGLYSDGMQYNNALGAHTESVEMLYYFFPCLDDPLNELNTFLASIVMSKDVKSYGNGKCFAPLVDVFNKLFNKGISVEIEGKVKTVKFLLGNITGDNLAMNAILDYLKSFSANVFCRFCLCTSSETVNLFREVPHKLRTRENYKEMLKIRNPSLSGISTDCIFNLLPYFHCVDNKSSDIMHDYFEGICRYTFSHLILYLHFTKILTIEELNNRISDFCYGKEEIRYIPKIFEKIKLESNNMKVTAKEMWQFSYLLPAIIGDIIPPNDEIWEMSLNLIQAIELLLGSKFLPETIALIEHKIARHNFLYKKHFGDLTPKMHLATHIGTSIKSMGPPRHYMCFRMEEKHRYFKIYAHIINCRKNMPVSFASKYALFFANYLENGKNISNVFFDDKDKITTKYPHLLSVDVPCFKKIRILGSKIVSGMFVPFNSDLMLIDEISVTDHKVTLICTNIAKLNYCPHLDSYILNRVPRTTEPIVIDYKLLNSQPVYIYKTFDGKEIVRFKNYFSVD